MAVPRRQPPTTGPALPTGVMRGILLLLIGLAGFAIMSALAKLLSQDLSPLQVVFFRSAFAFLVLVPLLLRHGVGIVRTRIPGQHLLRAVVGMCGMATSFVAIALLPLATVTTVSFAKSLFLVLLAIPFLGETVGWRRLTATAVGFAGVLVVLRPGSGVVDPALLIALASAGFGAFVVILIKRMPDTEPTLTILFYFALFSTLVSALPAIVVWQNPTPTQWLLGVAIGVIGFASQALTTVGYRLAEASTAAPLDYTSLLYATALGFFMFDELPDRWTFVGAAIIIASTIYITRREARLGRSKPIVPPQ